MMDTFPTNDQSPGGGIYHITAIVAYNRYVIDPVTQNFPPDPNWKQAMPVLPKDLKEMNPKFLTRITLGVPVGLVPEGAKCSHIKAKKECTGSCYIVQTSPEHPCLKAATKTMEELFEDSIKGKCAVLPRKYHGGNHQDKIFIDAEGFAWLINIEGWEELHDEVLESVAKLSSFAMRTTKGD
jgi:hypothetical protein